MSWEETSLGKVSTITMGSSPPSSTYNPTGNGLPFFQGVRDFGDQYPRERVYCSHPARTAELGDILFSVRAPIGKINRARQRCAIGRGISSIRTSTEQDTTFLEYLLRSMSNLWGRYESQGAIFGNIRRVELEKMKILWPPKDIRESIASTLSAYDDLIENNRRRIELLEESARLLYKEWFVHLRFPGHNQTPITNGVPEGWNNGTIDNLCERQKTPYSDGDAGLPLVDLARVRPKTIAVDKTGKSSDLTTSRILFEENDILFGSIRPYLHKVVLAPFRGITNISVFVMRPKKPQHRAFSTILLSSDPAISYATQHATGTKMPVVKWGSIQSMPVLIPSESVLKNFQVTTAPLLEQIKFFHFFNRSLATAQDLLLPRLMNGRVQV